MRIEQVDKRVIAYLLLCDFVLNFVDCYCSSVPRAFTLLLRIVSRNDPDHVSLLWTLALKHEQEGTDLYKSSMSGKHHLAVFKHFLLFGREIRY